MRRHSPNTLHHTDCTRRATAGRRNRYIFAAAFVLDPNTIEIINMIYHRFFCLLAEKDSFLRGGRARCTLPWFQLSHHRTHKNIPKISRRTVPWLNPDSN